MGSITVSFADVPDRSPIKPGKYECVIQQVEVKQSEQGEHPYLNWTLEISEGEHEGRKLYMITSLSPKALWNLQNVLQSFGLEGDEVELEIDEDTNMLISPDLTGESAVATVAAQMYQGKPSSKVTALTGNVAPPKKKAAKKVEVEEEEEEEEEEEKPAKKSATKVKPKAKKEEPEDEEEEEEEEEEKTAKKAAAKPATKKVSPFGKPKRSFR